MNLMIINKNINRTLLLIASLVILTVHANDDSKFCSMEAENWRFTEVDYSSAYNDFGGIFNAPNYPNKGRCQWVRLYLHDLHFPKLKSIHHL
jgi:hypothetical protein